MSDSKTEDREISINPEFLNTLQISAQRYEMMKGPVEVHREEDHEDPLEEVLRAEKFVYETGDLEGYEERRHTFDGDYTKKLPRNYVIDVDGSDTDNPLLQRFGL